MKHHQRGNLADFWRECRVVYHTALCNRAARRNDAATWMRHRARLVLLDRQRNPAMARAFKEAGLVA